MKNKSLKELRIMYPNIKATSKKVFLEKANENLRETQEQFKTSEGLGDTIEKITEATGIKKAIDWAVGGKDCGCSERKAWLNEHFRYNAQCMVKSEYEWFKGFLKRQQKTKVEKEDIFELSRMFQRIFRKKAGICRSCPSGWKRTQEIITHLNNVYESYNN